MTYDDDLHHIRQQIKHRYNRRFFLGAHIVVLLVLLAAVWFAPSLRLLALAAFVTLLPHALYVAYAEYRGWLSHRVERELDDRYYPEPYYEYETAKRKRYPVDGDDYDPLHYRLTDDGEIEPVNRRVAEDDVPPEVSGRGRYDRRRTARYTRDSRSRPRKPSKRRYKDDTGEFDVKKLLKKLKDIVD